MGLPGLAREKTLAGPSASLSDRQSGGSAGTRLRAGPVLAASLFLFAFLLALFPIKSLDIWWHLANGREIAEGRGIPAKNLYSFTHPDYEVTPTHWLFGAAAYLVHSAAGVNGLIIAKAVVVAAAFALVFSLARRRGAGALAGALVAALACRASSRRFLVRPHIFTMLGLVGFAYLIELFRQAEPRKRGWPLLAMPPLAALWSNIHAGCLFGVMLVALEATGEAVCWLLSRRKRGPRDARTSAAKRRALALGGIALACAVAVMANPAGLGVYTYNLWHIELREVVRLVEFARARPLHRPFFYLLLAVGAAALAADRRQVRPGDALVFLVFGAFGVYAVRGIPNFALLASPVVAPRISSIWQRLVARGSVARFAELADRASADKHRVPLAATSAAMLIFPFALHLSGRHHIGLGLRPDWFPEGAADFVEREIKSPRVFNEFGMGGYLAWRWYPRRRTFLDGRTNAYPPELLRELYIREAYGGEYTEELIEGVFERYRIDCALLTYPDWGNSFWRAFDLGRWAVVYADAAALVLVRRTDQFCGLIERFENRLGAGGEQVLSRRLSARKSRDDARRAAAAAERALRAEAASGRRIFTDAERAGLNFSLAVGAQLAGKHEKAVAFYLTTLELRDDFIMAHINLGFALLDLRKPDLARPEFEWVLRRKPGVPRALLGLAGSLESVGLKGQAASVYREFLAGGRGRPQDVEAVKKRLESLER